MEIPEQVLNAALAGLLHDVGKYLPPDSATVLNREEPDWTEVVQKASAYASAGGDQNKDQSPARLLSIFSHLKDHQIQAYVPITRLNPLDDKLLYPQPIEATGDQKSTAIEYSRLQNEFKGACLSANLVALHDSNRYLETMLDLLQKYAWCIPCPGMGSATDVSLYDHARTTAAIAACLAADQQTVGGAESSINTNQPVCLLVWADLSGLQKFIYNLASEGAAKCLRARSFYVQMLTEALAHTMLDELGLPITNLIYVGGGGFQLLAHVGAEKTLPDILADLTERLLTVHQGDLGLTVEWEQVSPADFKQFGAVYERLGSKLNLAKRKPFAKSSAQSLFDAIGQPLTQGGDPIQFCSVTGEDGQYLVPGSNPPKSKFVDSLEKLGLQLPHAEMIVTARVKKTTPARAIDWRAALKNFGYDFQVLTKQEPKLIVQSLQGEFLRIWQLAPLSSGAANTSPSIQVPHVMSYRPFAQLTPQILDSQTKQMRPKTFDELSQNPVHPGCGFERWGVLRMDVDNMGTLFKDGFGNNASLARIASLSFALRLFFEGHLPALAKGKKSGEMHTLDLTPYLYIQYSGGDDLFIVGAWDALPEFARRIRSAFRSYTAGNPAVTLSGGMEMFQQKYPLYLAAVEAGDAEGKAKDMDKKDAFCMLNTPVKWKEFEECQRRAYRLADLVESRQAQRSLIQTLLMLQVEQKTNLKNSKQKTKPWYGRWMWLAAYQLTRVLRRIHKSDVQARTEIESLRDQFTNPNGDLAQIALSARWAQFLTRSRGGS